MNRRYVKKNLLAYLDGTLTARQRARMEAYIAACPRCRAIVAEEKARAQALKQAMTEATRDSDINAFMTTRVLAAWDTDTVKKAHKTQRRLTIQWSALGGVVAMLLLLIALPTVHEYVPRLRGVVDERETIREDTHDYVTEASTAEMKISTMPAMPTRGAIEHVTEHAMEGDGMHEEGFADGDVAYDSILVADMAFTTAGARDDETDMSDSLAEKPEEPVLSRVTRAEPRTDIAAQRSRRARIAMASRPDMPQERAETDSNEGPHLSYVTQIADALAALPDMTTTPPQRRPRAWGVFRPRVVDEIEESGKIEMVQSVLPGDYTRFDGYSHQFLQRDRVVGYILYGFFASVDDARAAFLFGTPTTEGGWHYDTALEEKLEPKPDDVMRTATGSIMLRTGTICILIHVFEDGDGEKESIVDSVEIAKIILSEIAVMADEETE